jgi:hypothetical protein
MFKLQTGIYNIPKKNLDIFLISHIMETIPYDIRLSLYIDILQTYDNTNQVIINKMKKYIEDQTININGKKIIKIQDPNNTNIDVHNLYNIVKNEDDTYKLHDVEYDIELEYEKIMKENTMKYINNLNDIIGMVTINAIKKSNYIFKTRYVKLSRNKGIKCLDSSKPKAIKALNEILGDVIFTKENTSSNVMIELCCLQEFLLRQNNYINLDGKFYMFNYEQYSYIEQYKTK